jgi:glycine betaine/proline transport system permease protein
MAAFESMFSFLGLSDWCEGGKQKSLISLKNLKAEETAWWDIPFPSLDNLHKACSSIPQSRDLTAALEDGFLYIRPSLRVILDPITQPLSWMLDAALYVFTNMPWWILLPLFVVAVQWSARSWKITSFVVACIIFYLATDHYSYAMQTLSIIFVCTMLCVLIGVPTGILMARSNTFQRMLIPILDMLQTLPTFVYLIPLIFIFKITEPKLYGLAIILYAIVPVIRLTDLGIRLVDKDVIEAANAYGMTKRQLLFNVQIPLAMPNIMAGVNQTIMMSLAMVVIASLVSAPGLGTLVLDGINNLRLGVGFMAGIGIVLLAIILDRVSKSALARMNKTYNG